MPMCKHSNIISTLSDSQNLKAFGCGLCPEACLKWSLFLIVHKAYGAKFSNHTVKIIFLSGAGSYPILFKFVGDLKGLSGADHGLHGGEDVLVNKPDEAPLIFIWVPRSMNDPHLLDEGALATFSRTWTGQERHRVSDRVQQTYIVGTVAKAWPVITAKIQTVSKKKTKKQEEINVTLHVSMSNYYGKMCIVVSDSFPYY